MTVDPGTGPGTSPGTGTATATVTDGGSASEGMTKGTTDAPTSGPEPTTATSEPGTTTSMTSGETTAASTTGPVSGSSSTGVPGPVCGNGLVEMGEECDDGDALDKNACSNACTKVPCDQQDSGMDLEGVLSYIWISNSSQNTVSKINAVKAANSGEYGGIQRVA